VVVLSGSGRAFCSGYDLTLFAQNETESSQEMPWDPLLDYKFMSACTQAFMSIWRCMKPVICKIRGVAIAGGSDIALCCDLIVMEENAKIGYPPARLWGCPTTAHWVYKVGVTRAKELLLTGDVISGKRAQEIGLINKACPPDELDAETDKLVKRLLGVPRNQLAMQKLVINNAIEQQGLLSTQRLAVVFDGIARHTPEGIAFKKRSEEVGWKQAVIERDAGTFKFPPSKL